MTIWTIAFTITGVSGGGKGGGDSTSQTKDKESFKKWLNRPADVLRTLVGKAAEALPATMGSTVGAILIFLGKAVVFVSKHTCH